jgi:hypothetical protein
MVNLLFFLALCIGSAIFYRLGGAKGYNTKFRDLGCPLMAVLALWFLLGKFSLLPYFLTFGLMFAALTTYWDEVFGYDNMYAHGFMIGLSTLPFLGIILWWKIIIYAIILGLSMGLFSHKINVSAVVKELFRGFVIIALLIIFKK